MHKFTICLTSLLLLLSLAACQADDSGPLEDQVIDTVDDRLPYLGLFDVVEMSWGYMQDTTWTPFTDSVKLAYDHSVAMPITQGGYHVMGFHGGALVQDYEHTGPPSPQQWSGMMSLDSFQLTVHMDIQPHWYASQWTAHRH